MWGVMLAGFGGAFVGVCAGAVLAAAGKGEMMAENTRLLEENTKLAKQLQLCREQAMYVTYSKWGQMK